MKTIYDYTKYKEADAFQFLEACRQIEKQFPTWKKEPVLIDVDGSQIQEYKKGQERIVVSNDYYVDAVYVESEIELNNLFGRPTRVYQKE